MRGFKVGVVAAGCHDDVLCRIGRAHRGLRGDHLTAGGPGLHRRAKRQRPERQRRTAGLRLSCLARNAGVSRQGKKTQGPPLRGRAACRPIALWKARGASSSDPKGSSPSDATTDVDAHGLTPSRPSPTP